MWDNDLVALCKVLDDLEARDADDMAAAASIVESKGKRRGAKQAAPSKTKAAPASSHGFGEKPKHNDVMEIQTMMQTPVRNCEELLQKIAAKVRKDATPADAVMVPSDHNDD